MMSNNVLLFRGNRVPRDMRDAVDLLIGAKLRELRNGKSWSQEALGKKLGVSAFQIQKYEIGINRIRSETLSSIAMLLGVPVAFFFESCAFSEPVACGGVETENQTLSHTREINPEIQPGRFPEEESNQS